MLLLVVASLRADHASGYGYRRDTTPALDALASSGILYENAVTTAPWGPTAQASLLTGLPPTQHAVVFDHPVLEPALVSLAESLKTSGYATLGVSTDPAIGGDWGFDQGFDTFVEVAPDQQGAPDEGSAAAEKALLDWVAARRAGAEPFFAYVLLSNPRLPFDPPGEFRQKFVESPVPLPRLEQLSQYWLPFARQLAMGLATLTPEETGALVSLYDGEVAYADYRIGRIVEALRASGRLDRTLIVITSDLGEDLGEHGLLADSSHLYDSIVRVPLVMRLPGRVPQGRRVAEQVQSVDVGRAVLALTAPGPSPPTSPPPPAAFPMPARPEAILEGRVDPATIRAYRALLPGEDLSVLERNLLAVRTGDYKFVYSSQGTATLYDLKADPGETRAVIRERPEVATELAAKLDAWATSMGTPLGLAPPAAPATAASPTAHEEAAPRPPAR